MGKEFSIEQMQALMECVNANGISDFSYKNGETQLRIRGKQMETVQQVLAAPVASMSAPAQLAPNATDAPMEAPFAAPVPIVEAKCITSPLVGTFYSASAPDQEAFVKVGQTVKAGDVVFIVESMKVMNEVPADKSGVVVGILVENGASVEYGQTILRLE